MEPNCEVIVLKTRNSFVPRRCRGVGSAVVSSSRVSRVGEKKRLGKQLTKQQENGDERVRRRNLVTNVNECERETHS